MRHASHVSALHGVRHAGVQACRHAGLQAHRHASAHTGTSSCRHAHRILCCEQRRRPLRSRPTRGFLPARTAALVQMPALVRIPALVQMPALVRWWLGNLLQRAEHACRQACRLPTSSPRLRAPPRIKTARHHPSHPLLLAPPPRACREHRRPPSRACSTHAPAPAFPTTAPPALLRAPVHSPPEPTMDDGPPAAADSCAAAAVSPSCDSAPRLAAPPPATSRSPDPRLHPSHPLSAPWGPVHSSCGPWASAVWRPLPGLAPVTAGGPQPASAPPYSAQPAPQPALTPAAAPWHARAWPSSRYYPETHAGLPPLAPPRPVPPTSDDDTFYALAPGVTIAGGSSGDSASPRALGRASPRPHNNRSLLRPSTAGACADELELHHDAPSAARFSSTLWQDEKTICFQVYLNGVLVARRNGTFPRFCFTCRVCVRARAVADDESMTRDRLTQSILHTPACQDNDMVNGTKLLNLCNLTRGKRDSILKNQPVRKVIKTGTLFFKGVWYVRTYCCSAGPKVLYCRHGPYLTSVSGHRAGRIKLETARALAAQYRILPDLYPLFEDKARLERFAISPENAQRTAAVLAAARQYRVAISPGCLDMLPPPRPYLDAPESSVNHTSNEPIGSGSYSALPRDTLVDPGNESATLAMDVPLHTPNTTSRVLPSSLLPVAGEEATGALVMSHHHHNAREHPALPRSGEFGAGEAAALTWLEGCGATPAVPHRSRGLCTRLGLPTPPWSAPGSLSRAPPAEIGVGAEGGAPRPATGTTGPGAGASVVSDVGAPCAVVGGSEGEGEGEGKARPVPPVPVEAPSSRPCSAGSAASAGSAHSGSAPDLCRSASAASAVSSVPTPLPAVLGDGRKRAQSPPARASEPMPESGNGPGRGTKRSAAQLDEAASAAAVARPPHAVRTVGVVGVSAGMSARVAPNARVP